MYFFYPFEREKKPFINRDKENAFASHLRSHGLPTKSLAKQSICIYNGGRIACHGCLEKKTPAFPRASLLFSCPNRRSTANNKSPLQPLPTFLVRTDIEKKRKRKTDNFDLVFFSFLLFPCAKKRWSWDPKGRRAPSNLL